MIDAAKLKYYCAIKEITMGDLAKALGIDQATIYRKLSGKSDFYRHEINSVKEILKLSAKEMNEIFFNPELE